MKCAFCDRTAFVTIPEFLGVEDVPTTIETGLRNLFADMTYEGARSINGPFLGSLGASAAIVGIVAGLGELLGLQSSFSLWILGRQHSQVLASRTLGLLHQHARGPTRSIPALIVFSVVLQLAALPVLLFANRH